MCIDDVVPYSPATLAPPLAAASSEHVKRAPYTLNRTKQVTKLWNDASINDYEINVSPTAQNINVLCSTGFYSLVVLPAFSSLYVGYTKKTLSVNIHVNDITGTPMLIHCISSNSILIVARVTMLL